MLDTDASPQIDSFRHSMSADRVTICILLHLAQVVFAQRLHVAAPIRSGFTELGNQNRIEQSNDILFLVGSGARVIDLDSAGLITY